ncbi:MAG TPA: sigma-70 family RNA polymerase sigma factor [Anaerolineae bacterium]|nr:sigma-70 family RNA polymerase sigma factor [Anaerolineae bacterium]
MKERTNEEWLEALRGPERDEALADLRAFLVRGLGYGLASRSDVDDQILEDFVQDALLKILNALDSFRGESRFTTWAQKIAVNVAFTELRRRRWQDTSLDQLTEGQSLDFVPDLLVDHSAGPDQQAVQRLFLEALQRIIATELTDKQRQALVAVRIKGMPLEEVARRMGTNRNALYKLLHDARQRLKKKMEEEGLSPQDVLDAFSFAG